MIVLGIDAALVNTGVAAIKDGRAAWWGTIKVDGDTTGPRYVALRRGVERLLSKMRKEPPAVVLVEEPGEEIRRNRDPYNVMKLYGAFTVIYVEVARLFPRARIVGEPADSLQKSLREGIMRAKYRVECKNDHEWDALMLADRAWDMAVAELRRKERESR